MRGAAGALRGAGFAGPPLIVLAALGECAGSEFAGGDASRAISPVEPSRPGLASGLSESVRDRVAVAEEDGPVGLSRVAASAVRALRN